MAYAIMRCKKLVSMGSCAASLQHCFRERDTPNADKQKTPENEHKLAASTDEAMGRLRELLPEKRRKDAVLAVEYVMTASPSWWAEASKQQQKDFFDKAQSWLAQKYGAENIFAATVHRDEKTPHLSAFVVPITKDGRLSAKEFIGNRAKMTQDQTDFAKQVYDLGLLRGIEKSQAKHQTIKNFYAQIENSPPRLHFMPLGLIDTKKRVKKKIPETDYDQNVRINDLLKYYIGDLNAKALAFEAMKQENQAAKSELADLKDQLGVLKPIYQMIKMGEPAKINQLINAIRNNPRQNLSQSPVEAPQRPKPSLKL